MSKTINYELAKKLYDAGVRIESEWRYCIGWDKCETEWTLIHEDDESASYTDYLYTPNCEEVIEFLKEKIDWITYSKMVWFVIHFELKSITWPTLLKALEATLEYLLDNRHIWIEKK